MQLWLRNRMQYNHSRRKSKTRPKRPKHKKNTINAMFTSLWHIGGLNFWLRVQTCVIFSKSDDFTWSLFWLIISFEIERKWTFWNRPNRRCRRGFSAVHIWPHEYYSLWQNVRIFSKGLFSFKKTFWNFLQFFSSNWNWMKSKSTEPLYFHEFLALFWIYIFLVKS